MQLNVTVTNNTTRACLATVAFNAAFETVNQPWRIDWGDGTIDSIVAGTLTKTHTYAKDGSYNISARCNDSRSSQVLTVGVLPFPVFDPDKPRLTWPERWKRESDRVAAMTQVKDELGDDAGNSAGGYTVKNPTTKQADS
jgi:hypothetical protein